MKGSAVVLGAVEGVHSDIGIVREAQGSMAPKRF